MKKFSQIERVDGQKLLIFKSGSNSPKEWFKCSFELIKRYCLNLTSNEHLNLDPREKDNFDFYTYKVKSISREDDDKWIVTLETFDEVRKPLGEKVFNLQAK